jgi:dihydrofolate reductase
VLRFEKFLGQVGVILMGRTTFDVVQSFDVWPYGQLPLLVATHRALKSKQQEVRPVSGSIHELVEQARAMSGDKDIYLDGCALVQQALNAGLVDEMTLTFIPILLGGGIRLFEHLEAPKRVQFASSRPFDQGALQVTLRL